MTLEITKSKRVYICPEVTRVKLDNEISLQLESTPDIPDGDEVYNMDAYKQDPYKTFT